MNSKEKIGFVERLCMLSGMGLAAATVAGFLGRLFWVFDLFSHFRVQLFQAFLVLIGIAVWKRQTKRMIAFILLACLNYAFVLPLYFGKPPVATEQPARAMLMNLNASNGNAEEVLSAIRTAEPDLLLLEEVTSKWAGVLSVLNADYPYHVSKLRDDPFGIMLLSKHPLSRTNVVVIGSAGVPSIVADVHLPQGEISVIGTHSVAPVSASYSKHRNQQLYALPQIVKQQKNPVLLIGDLNASPWSPHFTRLLKDSGLQNSMQSFGFQPSWPVNNRFLRIPIDHVLHAPEIIIHSRVVGTDIGSDHFPLIVDFSVK